MAEVDVRAYPGKAAFQESLNSSYRLSVDGRAVDLALVEVTEGRSSPAHEQYSLLFRGPGAVLLPQQIYRLEHAQLGRLDLFLVPIKQDNEGIYYEAVFNLLLDDGATNKPGGEGR